MSQNEVNKKYTKGKQKNLFSPVIAMVLFVAAAVVTYILFSNSLGNPIDQDADMRAIGQEIRQALEGEQGEEVADINGNKYYERDLDVIIANLKIYKTFQKMTEEQQRQQAGDELILQELYLLEFDRLGLEVTEEEFNENVDSMRTQMQEEIANETASAAQFQQYLEGMGLTFSQYWQDEYTRVALRNDLKTQKVREYICMEIEGLSSVNENAVLSYLSGLIEDGTYHIVLFGEEYQ